jgi:hypothetical protein
MQELQYSSSFGVYYDLSISDLSPSELFTFSDGEDPPFNYCPG